MNLKHLLTLVCPYGGLLLGHAHAAQYAQLVGVSVYPKLTKLSSVCFDVQELYGQDRLIAIAVPARLGLPATDLCFLAEVHLERNRNLDMAGDLEVLLTKAAFGTEQGASQGAARSRVGQLSRAMVRLEQWVSQSSEAGDDNLFKAISPPMGRSALTMRIKSSVRRYSIISS